MDSVKFIRGISNDPRFNLASEEVLLKRREGKYVYVWINSPAVIVGVNQNAAEEVDLAFTDAEGIPVIRRQTGGGAVYHDRGCICFTIIDGFDGGRDNYRFFTEGVIEYLASLGVAAEFSGRNDVTAGGRKISGNAQCVYKGRIMHHGTLLFDTDLEMLGRALRPHRFKVESKGIKSARARVENIRRLLLKDMTSEEFFDGLCNFYLGRAEEYKFTEADVEEINSLAKGKYSDFLWNVGTSPKAAYRAEKKLPCGVVTVSFDVEEGRLMNVDIRGDFFSYSEISGLNHTLNGTFYKKADIMNALSDVSSYIVGSTPEEICLLFFE